MYKILIVEDDLIIASLLKEHIEKYEYEVHLIQSFRDIKQEFIQLSPSLVLLDINLPYFDGFYWCRQKRTISNCPIIFISAREGDMDQVMAIENGGDDFITKPFSFDIVMAKMKSLLRRTNGQYATVAETKYIGCRRPWKGYTKSSLAKFATQMNEKNTGVFFTSKVERYLEMKQAASLTLFIGLFVSVLFYLASGNIIYFKLFNDLEKDRFHFRSLGLIQPCKI